MNHALLGGLSALLFPFAAHAAATAAGGYLLRGGYQPRSHARLQVDALAPAVLASHGARPRDWQATTPTDSASLDIQTQGAATELVVIDGAVADKATLYRGLKPGVVAVEIDPTRPGLPQLAEALRGHRNLAAIHVVSHAIAGELRLGSSRITAETLSNDRQALGALRDAVREGGDLLLYGCDLAANMAGEELLDIIRNLTAVDIAASTNLTGSSNLNGDWTLEVQRGNVEASLAFSEKALKDYSGVLTPGGTKTFESVTNEVYTVNPSMTFAAHEFAAYVKSTQPEIINGTNVGPCIDDLYVNMAYADSKFYIRSEPSGQVFGVDRLVMRRSNSAPATNITIEGFDTIASTAPSASKANVSLAAAQAATLVDLTAGVTGSFSSIQKIRIIPNDNNAFCINSITFSQPPSVTDGRIGISGASGTGGAYKIGDTVTATWNNTAGGDNNTGITGVTVDFSQFGGGTAVAASNSGGTWTATYTITSGSIDATGRNVSVTATNAGGSTTTFDTTNATVDNIAPVVTNGNISISGATGAGGAFKIGDTVTATWNNTAGGDNNSDTISGVTVNFSQFGGGASVAASNSGGTWTATYTIVAGAIAASNLNVAVTATDNAGNATSAADSTNATVDNIAPSVSSIVVSGAPGSGDTSMAFTVNFSESVANISTDDFTLVGTGSAAGSIASVSANTGSSVNVNITGISGSGTLKIDLNGSTNIIDAVGNSVPSYSSGSTHTVNILTVPGAPTIGSATAGDAQASVTFSAPASNGGSAITTYTATASPGGAFGSCAGPAACTAVVTGLTNGTSYTFKVTATNGVGTSASSAASSAVTPKANQVITFAQPPNYNFGTTSTLSASSTYAVGGGATGLVVSFTSSTTGVCTVTAGGALTFLTAGTCTIDADQAGNASTNGATTVTRSFTVNAIVPSAPTIGTATAGDQQASVTFTAPSSNGGANITGYTVTSNPGGNTGTGTNAGSPITVPGLTNGVSYTFTVTATSSAGTGSASGSSNSVTPKGVQTITFANPGSQNFGTHPDLRVVNGGASATSGLNVTFTSSTTGVCTVTPEGVLSFITVGTCTISADQAGDGSYLPATQVSRSFTVNAVVPGAPTIGTATPGDTQASVAFTAPGNTGGTTITGYTVTVSPAHVAPVNGAGTPIVVTGLTNGQAYTFTVTADNSAGTGPASAASNSVTPKATQTITFANPGSQNFGTTPTLTATSDSGLTPTFTSSTLGACTITPGGALTFVTTGTCTINADQAGNGSYLPATQVSRSFTVNAVVPGAPTIGTATPGDQQATVAFTAPVAGGGATITSYTVTSNPGNKTGAGTSSPITVTGLTNGTAYTFTVTATNSAGTGTASAASNSVTPKMGQTITFAQPANQRLDATLTLAATASSGLVVAFSADAATLAVCEITSGALIFHTAGACTIHADQAGDGQYLAAPRVSRTFNVQTAAPGAPTSVVATAGDTQARVAFTAPTDAGTSPITGYTVTVQPGGATVTGTASPIAVPGLTNGVAYTFTVTATNAAGTGAASSPSNSVTPKGVVQGTVPTPTSGAGTTGTATASTAALDPVQDPNCRLAGAQFAGEVPPGYTVSYGSFEFLATGCQHGVAISLSYPQALPYGVRFMKFGPPSFGAPDEWMDWTSKVQLSADRKTATYSVLDNGAGDSDPRVGLVADPLIPAGLSVPGPSGAAAIPTLGEWALALLAALLGLLGWRQGRAKAA